MPFTFWCHYPTVAILLLPNPRQGLTLDSPQSRLTMIGCQLLKKQVVVQFVWVLEHLALDLGSVHPCYKILHTASHQESWICDCLRANPDVTLQRTSRNLRLTMLYASRTSCTEQDEAMRHPRNQEYTGIEWKACLLNKCAGLLHGFWHFQADKHHCQPPPAEACSRKLFQLHQAFLGGDDPHRI